jgi:hypothetical protein
MGFIIRKKADSVRVAFDTLNFIAFVNECGELFITKGREQIASIGIYFVGETDSWETKCTKEAVSFFEKEIEKEETLSKNLENPVIQAED